MTIADRCQTHDVQSFIDSRFIGITPYKRLALHKRSIRGRTHKCPCPLRPEEQRKSRHDNMDVAIERPPRRSQGWQRFRPLLMMWTAEYARPSVAVQKSALLLPRVRHADF